jgi:TetR/AcrR family transcriptional regulator
VGRPKVIEETELLDRLLDAFADLGYHGTSLRELCRHLGISHNLVHRRYHSKEAAWRAAVDHGFEQLFKALRAAPDEQPDDRLEMLRGYMLRYATVTIQRPALARIIQQESARPGPRFEYMFTRYIGPTRRASAKLLAELQDAGRVREGAVETVYFFLTTWGIGGLGSAPDEIRGAGGRGPSGPTLARLAVDVVISGLQVARPTS